MSARNCAVFHRLMFNVALIFQRGQCGKMQYNYMQQFAYLCELALKIHIYFFWGASPPRPPTGVSPLDPTGGSRPQTPTICSPRKIFLATPLHVTVNLHSSSANSWYQDKLINYCVVSGFYSDIYSWLVFAFRGTMVKLLFLVRVSVRVRVELRVRVSIAVRVRDSRPMFAIVTLKLHVSLIFSRHTGYVQFAIILL